MHDLLPEGRSGAGDESAGSDFAGMAKKITWWQAAEILGLSDRSMRRWRERYEEFGYDGLLDRRQARVRRNGCQWRWWSRCTLLPPLHLLITVRLFQHPHLLTSTTTASTDRRGFVATNVELSNEPGAHLSNDDSAGRVQSPGGKVSRIRQIKPDSFR